MAKHRATGQHEVLEDEHPSYSNRQSLPNHAPTPTAAMPSVTSGPSISVMKLQVPFPVMITVILSVSALVFSIALTSFRLISHVQAAEAHLDSKAVITGGGVAYRMDVLQLRGDFERKMRQTLKTMAINCRQKDDGMVCSVDIPEVP